MDKQGIEWVVREMGDLAPMPGKHVMRLGPSVFFPISLDPDLNLTSDIDHPTVNRDVILSLPRKLATFRVDL